MRSHGILLIVIHQLWGKVGFFWIPRTRTLVDVSMLYDERPHNQNEIIIMINRNNLIFDFEELAVQCIKEIWPTCKIEVDGIKISCRKHILWKKDIITYSESLCQKWYGKTNVLFGQSRAVTEGHLFHLKRLTRLLASPNPTRSCIPVNKQRNKQIVSTI